MKLSVVLLCLVVLVRAEEYEYEEPENCRVGMDDYDCVLGQSCNTKTHECSCREIHCRLFCPHGWARSEGGCYKCQCATEPEIARCPGVRCGLECRHGFQKDAIDCEMCRCRDPNATTIAPTTTLAPIDKQALKECLKRKGHNRFYDWIRRKTDCKEIIKRYHQEIGIE